MKESTLKRILGALVALISTAALGATLAPVQLLSPAGSTAGQAIVSTGPSTAPAWGNVTATALAPVAANTVIANATGSSAAPTAHAVPSCSTANSALKWTSGTGLSCGTTFALTSGNLSQFAATTSAQLAGVLSDETGTGVAVFSASPTFTGTANFAAVSTTGTATLNGLSTGGATISGGTINATSVGATTPSSGAFTTLSSTGAFTPSQTAGIVGTTTNNNANAGSVGEYVTATGTGVSLTSSTPANITSISLTAGDWDVSGFVVHLAAASTIINGAFTGISTTSATLPSQPNYGGMNGLSLTANSQMAVNAPVQRLSLSATTTVYLVSNAQFTTSTLTATGTIRARRVR